MWKDREESDEMKRIKRKVKKRDGHVCQLCKKRKRLQVHHILTYSKFPHLREDERNLVSLCIKCHDSLRRKEDFYAPLLIKIVGRKYENNN